MGAVVLVACMAGTVVVVGGLVWLDGRREAFEARRALEARVAPLEPPDGVGGRTTTPKAAYAPAKPRHGRSLPRPPRPLLALSDARPRRQRRIPRPHLRPGGPPVTNTQTGDRCACDKYAHASTSQPDGLDEETYPADLVVFCEGCGTEAAHDYIVSAVVTREERLEIARAHMRTNGWSCTDGGDFCPTCRTADPAPTADVSEWAASLGKAGLTPHPPAGWRCTGVGWEAAVQVATSHDLTEQARTELLAAIHAAVGETVHRVLGRKAAAERTDQP